MQRSIPDREQWHLISPNLETQTNRGHKDFFVFFSLIFLLAGMFVLGEGSNLMHASAISEASANSESSAGPIRGVSVQNLTPAVARELGIPSGTTGVVVTSVVEGSPAAEAGLARGNLILEVNRKPAHNVAEYNRSLAGLKGRSVLLLIERGGTTNSVVVQSH